jgi:integrase
MANIQSRKRADGSYSFRVQIRVDGYPPQRATFSRKTDARRWAEKTESAIRDGKHFLVHESGKRTLNELIDRYMCDVLPTKPKSEKSQRQQLGWWKAELGEQLIHKVTASMIGAARDRLARMGLKGKPSRPATVNRYLAALSHVFSVGAKEWDWVVASPFSKVRKLREPRGRVRFLSDDERDALLDACAASSNRYLYPVVVLALSTGMRLREIMNLTWRDVDLERGRLTLRETKNGEIRVVPLAGHALRTLTKIHDDDRPKHHLVFPSRKRVAADRVRQPIDLRRPWEIALERAEVLDFRFHDLRHSAASYLAMNNASPNEIAEILGHKTLQMVKRYAHLSEAHTAGVVASMNDKIFGARLAAKAASRE